MADPLIDALRGGKLAGVKAEIKKAPEKTLGRATVEAGRLAFQAALDLLLKERRRRQRALGWIPAAACAFAGGSEEDGRKAYA